MSGGIQVSTDAIAPPRGGETTYLDAIRAAMWEEMEHDPRVFLIGEDVGVFGGPFKVSAGLVERYGPDRVIDTPIAENAILGAACGAALMGMRPIAEMQFMNFVTVAFDMLSSFAATSRYRGNGACPIVVRGPAGGGVRGGPFHSGNPEAYFFNIPGLKIVYPGTAYDAKGLLKAAIRDEDPVIFLEHKFLYRRLKEEVPEGDYTTPIGEARIARAGEDVSIITYGAMVHASLEAAELVAQEGIRVEILDLRTLLPMDRPRILETVEKTGRVLIVHEATKTGGPGGEIAALIAEHAFLHLDAPIVRVAPPDTPVPYSPPLEEFFLPNASKIADAIRALAEY